MNFLHNYNENIVKYDLINKFNYKNLNELPKFKSITLTFKLKLCNTQTLVSSLAALKIVSNQQPVLTSSKVSNISFNIRKGQPIGCKVTLRKKKLKMFLILILNNLQMKEVVFNCENSFLFSFKISNILIFNELEKNYQFFKNLSDLNINITAVNCEKKDFFFLLKSNKLII